MSKILIIDDDKHILDSTAMILEEAGYTVLKAEDGLRGLLTAKAERPDLIILDLAMPGMHGFEVCEKIKEDPELATIKVIIASGKNFPADKRMAEELGVDKYVVKPVDWDDFKRVVADMLEGVNSSPEPGTA